MNRCTFIALCAAIVVGSATHADGPDGLNGLVAAERAALEASGVVSAALLDQMPRGGRIPVLISYHEPVTASTRRDTSAHLAATARRGDDVLASLSRDEFQMTRRFQTLPIVAGELDHAGLARLANDPRVRWIEPQGGGRGALAESAPLTEISTARSFGLSGNGIRIAVVDSGVDTTHADLSGVVVEERCWCSGGGGCCPGGGSTEIGAAAAADDNGHGTHITGIIASNGSVAPPGAAMNVDVVAIKVLDNFNNFSTDADVIGALDWLNAESISQGSPYVNIVNMSLETTILYGRPCNPGSGGASISVAWTNAVTQLTDRGILVVAATGNKGVGGGAPAPACVEESFSVAGSYDANLGGIVWNWSGLPTCFPGSGPCCEPNVDPSCCSDVTTGPDVWACGSNAFNHLATGAKTDLVAPASSITSSWPGGFAVGLSGTSQAAAHVTGCAALVVEANAADPTRTLADLEADLQTTDVSITSTRAAFGSSFPRLDCAMAVPEPDAAPYSLALLFALAAAARFAAPARQPSRCPSR